MKIDTALKYIANIKQFEDLELGSARQLAEIEKTLTECRINIRGAIAALSQNKTFPADVKLAKEMLNDSL